MRIVGTNLPEDAWFNPVAVAATGAISLAAGSRAIDGVTVGQYNAGDPRVQRVLVWQQADSKTNGIYNATNDVPWSRALDANDNTQWAQGVQVLINGGSTYGGSVFRCSAAGTNGQIVVGTTLITFAIVAVTPIQLPSVDIRKPASAATVAILASDIDVGIDTRSTAVTINLPSAAAWRTLNPFALELVIDDYYGNAFTNNITPALNGADAFAGAYAASPPVISANSGLLRLRPDVTGGVAVGWIVRGVN